jgi:hypothetical protein
LSPRPSRPEGGLQADILKGDARAKAWLAGGGFEKALGKDGKFEQKPPKP